MGSLFRYGLSGDDDENVVKTASKQGGAKTGDDHDSPSGSYLPVATEPAIEDLTKPMAAPEVPLRDFLSYRANDLLDGLLSEGCSCILLDPEEEITRWYAVFPDKIREIDRTPIAEHQHFMTNMGACTNGAIPVGEERYRIEDFRSFNEFGDRYSLMFFREGAYSYDEAIAKRRETIRQINRLKPATALTVKNENEIAKILEKEKLAPAFLEHLRADNIISAERLEAAKSKNEEIIEVLRTINVPRKMAAIALADCLKVPYIEVCEVVLDNEFTHLESQDWKLERQALPFAKEDGCLAIAMANPTDSETFQHLASLCGLPPKIYCASARDVYNTIMRAHKDDD